MVNLINFWLHIMTYVPPLECKFLESRRVRGTQKMSV